MKSIQIDSLINQAVFSSSDSDKLQARKEIRRLAKTKGIYLASTHDLYMAFGKEKVSGFTVPAVNIRFLTYDTARVIFRVIKKHNIGPMIFEIARSEQKYTEQKADEYAVAVLAAAIAEDYQGPVCLQGDHYQFKASLYKTDPKSEIDNIKKLIKDSIEAGFYNIDIDASTLVDLTREKLDEQQVDNYMMTSLLTKFIRGIEPKGVTVSIGGEIGHIGGKNSTVEEFEAFMKGYRKEIRNSKFEIRNLSKVSVQTGTSHGGIPLPDGKIADVKLDFNVLKDIGKVAKKRYGLGGVVQHGASTLPVDLFNHFPKTKTLEVHLATGFQNTVFEFMPEKLKTQIYDWLQKNHKDEWKEKMSEEQFIYKTRKKAAGPFKKQLWAMTEAEKKPIIKNLEKQFETIFKKLKVFNTKKIVEKYC